VPDKNRELKLTDNSVHFDIKISPANGGTLILPFSD
jgi:hypothetical protein